MHHPNAKCTQMRLDNGGRLNIEIFSFQKGCCCSGVPLDKKDTEAKHVLKGSKDFSSCRASCFRRMAISCHRLVGRTIGEEVAEIPLLASRSNCICRLNVFGSSSAQS